VRPRQVIEKYVEDALERNTTRDVADTANDERGEPTSIRVPILDMSLVALEILLDIRDVLMLTAQATGKIKAQTSSGITIPG